MKIIVSSRQLSNTKFCSCGSW